jgi:hypothetical protein
MDRRFVLFTLTAALAVILGFFTLTAEQSLIAVIYGGYWAMLGLTVLFGWSLFRISRDSLAGGIAWR